MEGPDWGDEELGWDKVPDWDEEPDWDGEPDRCDLTPLYMCIST